MRQFRPNRGFASKVLSFPLSRICNPTATSISICNAHNYPTNIARIQRIFTHYKCLYSGRPETTNHTYFTNPLSRICNPTATSISICNAHNYLTNRIKGTIFTHYKCLYSTRPDYKSDRAGFFISQFSPYGGS